MSYFKSILDKVGLMSAGGDTDLHSHDTELVNYSAEHDHIKTVQDVINHMWSAGGCGTGFDITEIGDGTVTITSGSAVLRSVNEQHGELRGYTIPAVVTPMTFVDNKTNYILADYNGGSPQLTVTDDITTVFTDQTVAILYAVNRLGNDLNIVDFRAVNVDFIRRNNLKVSQVYGTEHAGGAMISDEGLQKFKITAGSFYLLNTPVTVPELDTSVDGVFEYVYGDSVTGWTRVPSQTQIDIVRYYDLANTKALADLTNNNKFGVHYVYAVLNTPAHFKVVYGSQEYDTLADAQHADRPADLPSDLNAASTAELIGIIIIQKNVAAFADIRSSYQYQLQSAVANNHANLAGLLLAQNTVTYGHINDQAQSITGIKSFLDKIQITGSVEQGGAGEEFDVTEYVGDAAADHTLVKLLGILPVAQDYAEIWGGEDTSGQFGKGFIVRHDKVNSEFEIWYSTSGLWNGTETLVAKVDSSGNLVTAGSVVLPKANTAGIKVDTTSPDWSWRDITGRIRPDPAGTDSPALTVFRDGVRAYAYSTSPTAKKIDMEFHIPHDWVVGTDLYLHVHWGHNGTAIGTTVDNIVFDHKVIYGSRDGVFGAGVNPIQTVSGLTIANTPQYSQRVDEIQLSAAAPAADQLDTDNIEVDGLVLVTLSPTTIPTISGGTSDLPFIFTCDIHYQSTNVGTKNSASPFYT